MPEQERRVSPEQNLANLFDRTAESAETPEPKAEPAPKARAEEQSEAKEPEAREPEAREPEARKAEAPEPEASESEASDDAIQVETIGELADALGIDVSELYGNLRIPVTSSDGERSEVTLGEWKDSYQSHAKTSRLQADLESRRAAFDKESAAAAQKWNQTIQEAGALLNAAEKQLLADYESVNWNELRQADPSEWAAKRQDFMERQRAINEAKQQATQEATRYQAEQTERSAKYRGEALQRESAALVAAIPDWKDETKAKTEKAALFDYLVSSGFKSDDVQSVVDHRVVVLARKAMLWDQRSKDGKEATKKLVKVAPKRVLKPGAAQAKADQQADARQSVRNRLRKSGRLEDFAALITRS